MAQPMPLFSTESKDSGGTYASYHTTHSILPYSGAPISSTQNNTASLVGKSPRIIIIMGPTSAGKSIFINVMIIALFFTFSLQAELSL
ncbi:hypothetical protein P691DRAFT_768899 [Macrolepiota fuliginosa MF-IS2]|uniref:G domain-containing protein n=1 Tax=Macrolepiota fuliginosa MF-IS2 TaxID=1400762 RepID=A0A9P6BUV7_9AGAR|nr:hypothetical protein P691DRAFT_768899 [Macrolepiota fuliginosa MF-IS2]